MPDFMPMLSWWQWIVLGAVPPAIVLLYFLKLKRHPVEVPSTYLWHKSIEDLHVNAIWQRLRNNILLWLQLLLILLLVLALFRPSWQGTKLEGSRFIFAIDNSASMSAEDQKPSRLDEAKRKIGELIDQMKSGQAAMLISFSDSARVEQAYTDNRGQLRRALEAIRPTARGTSLLEALKLAAGLANPGRSSEKDNRDTQVAEAMPATLYILSDGKFPPVTGFMFGNLDPKFIPIGLPEAKNIGILAFSAQRNDTRPDRLQAFARIENFGPQPEKITAQLYLDEHLVDASEAEITPNEPRGLSFDLSAVESGVLRLKIKSKDDLKLDDEASLVLHPQQRMRVLLVTPGNEPLSIALSTKSTQEIAEVQIEPPAFLKNKEKYQNPAAAGAFDLVIFDRCHPEQNPQANTLTIGDLPPGKLWKAEDKVEVPQLNDFNTTHPLMQWMDLSNVTFLAGTPLKPPPGGKMLIDSDRGILMAIAPRDAFEDLVMGFQFFQDEAGENGETRRIIATDWYSKQSFPVFVRNVFEYFGKGRGGGNTEGYRPGQSVALEVATPEATVHIKPPSGPNVDMKAGKTGKLSFTETNDLGIYELRSGGKTADRFAVNLFNAAESDIRPNPSPAIKVGDVEVKGEAASQAARKEIWKTLVLIGLAVLAAEWYIYNRRIY
jgi:hypothetical protein